MLPVKSTPSQHIRHQRRDRTVSFTPAKAILASPLETLDRQLMLLPSTAIVETVVRFSALDGYMLGATLYSIPEIGAKSTVVLFSCGGGVPAVRYARFARHLAATGVTVLVYDYRGIGASSPPHLRGFNALVEDWSELDCGGAIAYLRLHYPGSQLVGMAHSIGALMTCGPPNAAEISRFVFLCAHTAFYGDYLPRYRFPMAVLWHGVMPLVTRVFGYFPARMLGLGEDIPAGVALQWSARTNPNLRTERRGLAANRTRAMIDRYRQLRGDVLVVGFADDAFATPAGTQRLLEAFPGLHAKSVSIEPSQAGMATIGHFGLFRRSAEATLWPLVFRAFQDWALF